MPVQKKTVPKKAPQKKTTPKKTPVATVTVVEAPVVEAPVVETPVVDTPIVDTVGDVQQVPEMLNYGDEFSTLKDQLNEAMTLVKTLTSAVIALERRVARDKKVVDKKMKGKVRKVRDPNAPPTGFQKPIEITPELSVFMGTPVGQKVARTAVTKQITAYCKEHGLQNPGDKRILLPDKVLLKLLTYKPTKNGEPLTFFNLQKYVKHHYPKKDSEDVSAQ